MRTTDRRRYFTTVFAHHRMISPLCFLCFCRRLKVNSGVIREIWSLRRVYRRSRRWLSADAVWWLMQKHGRAWWVLMTSADKTTLISVNQTMSLWTHLSYIESSFCVDVMQMNKTCRALYTKENIIQTEFYDSAQAEGDGLILSMSLTLCNEK